MPEPLTKKRSATGACILSLFFSGLGQVYNGKLDRGSIVLVIDFLIYIFAVVTFFHSKTVSLFIIIISIIFRIITAIDAAALAKKTGETRLGVFNRWYFYLIYILISVSALIFSYFGAPKLFYRSFSVPTTSMENTILNGDYLWIEKSPGNIHPPKRGDLIIFAFPGNRDEAETRDIQYYMKRCEAIAGDTLLIVDKHVFVNGKESKLPEFGKFDPSYNESKNDKLRTFPVGAGFTANNYGPIRIPKTGDTIFLNPANFWAWEVFIRREQHKFELDETTILLDNKPVKYYIVQRDYCFAMGDNRDNSLDSRFFGFIPVEKVFGKPVYVYWSFASGYNDDGSKDSYIRWNRLGKRVD